MGVCLSILLIGGCSQPPQEPSKSAVIELVPREKLPAFKDDLDSPSLRNAVGQSLRFFQRTPADQTFSQGEVRISGDVLKASLLAFLELLDTDRLSLDAVAETFDVYRVAGGTPGEQPLVTGYYEPVVAGRLERDDHFRFPLYGIPPDLVTVELGPFDPARFAGERLTGRIQGRRVVPYFTRAEIDGQHLLDHHKGQLAWLNDPVDAFFLHIQGSGIIRLEDGRIFRIGYAGANGRPYRSIGKVLGDRGVISPEEMSMQAIRRYLKEHPGERDEVMWHNESYVFFRRVDEGPMGSLNVPLTAGRSIATDPLCFPRGALAYLETRKPRIDSMGQTGTEPLTRWVLNQDTGGAIKGPGRVDLFWGSGDEAEVQAGHMKQPGTLYLLIKKGETVIQPR